MREIITDRLRLRSFESGDWMDLFDYLSDAQVVAYEPYDPFTQEQCKQEAERRSGDKAFIAVSLNTTGKVIGNIYFDEREFGTWEIGYVFNSAYQRRGYASEAARAVISEAFLEGKARRVIATCNPDNAASWQLLERLNMRREGHLKKNIFFRKDEQDNPIWQDTYEYGILAEEWV